MTGLLNARRYTLALALAGGTASFLAGFSYGYSGHYIEISAAGWHVSLADRVDPEF